MSSTIVDAFNSQQRPAVQTGCRNRCAFITCARSPQDNARMRDAKLATYLKLTRREEHSAAKAIRANWEFGHRIDCGLDSLAIVAFARFYNHTDPYIRNRLVGV